MASNCTLLVPATAGSQTGPSDGRCMNTEKPGPTT